MTESVTATKLTLYMVTTPKYPIVCYRCGGSELANHCRFIEAEYCACWKKGHMPKFAIVSLQKHLHLLNLRNLATMNAVSSSLLSDNTNAYTMISITGKS